MQKETLFFFLFFFVVVAVITVVGCFFFPFVYFFCRGLFKLSVPLFVRVVHCVNTSLAYYAQLGKFTYPFFECLRN